MENKEDFYIFFQGNDENNFDIISPDELLQDYIIENNNEGEYDGYIEYSAVFKLYNMHINILINEYLIYMIITTNKMKIKNIYILFINENHFN